MKVQISDSYYRKVCVLELDTTKYKLVKEKHCKFKSMDNAQIEQFLIENGIYNKFKLLSYQEKRRDGIISKWPDRIQIETDVEDDRPLPEEHKSDDQKALEFYMKWLHRVFTI